MAEDKPPLMEARPGEGTADSGTTVVLQALMSTLGEVLGRLDRRLATLEEAVSEQPAGEWETTVLTSFERLTAGMAALERSVAEQRAGDAQAPVLASLEDLSARLTTLERAVTEQPVPEWETTVLASVEQLGERLASLERSAVEQRAGDDQAAVLATLEALSGRVERLHEQSAAQASLESVTTQLSELSAAVDTIGYGLASLADLVTSRLEGGGDELRTALAALASDVGELRRAMPLEVVGELRQVADHLDEEVRFLRGQPGPGPALAMVAAGLAERFEERTQVLADRLDANTAFSRRLWERIEDMLDGGRFEELVVGEALEHVIDTLESLRASIQEALALEEEPLPELHTAEETRALLEPALTAIGDGLGDVRARMESLAAALESPSASPEGRAQANALGRWATEAGRRWASDLGLRGRERGGPSPEDEREERGQGGGA